MSVLNKLPLEESLAEVRKEIERAIAPFAAEVALLRTIPGVDEVAAAPIVAEIGAETDHFPSAKHLASWAGLCPGNRESAGKRLGSKTTPGDTWLKGVLGEVAWAIARRKRDNYLTAQYHRLARKRGTHKAAVAVMHSVLVIAYHILRDKRPYSDLGADYFDTLDRTRLERYYVNRLSSLGYEVTLEPRAANTLSIHAKLTTAGVDDPTSDSEVGRARVRLLNFVERLGAILQDARQDGDGTVVGADPLLGDLALQFLSGTAAGARASAEEIPLDTLSALLCSMRPENMHRLVPLLTDLRGLIEERTYNDVTDILGDL